MWARPLGAKALAGIAIGALYVAAWILRGVLNWAWNTWPKIAWSIIGAGVLVWTVGWLVVWVKWWLEEVRPLGWRRWWREVVRPGFVAWRRERARDREAGRARDRAWARSLPWYEPRGGDWHRHGIRRLARAEHWHPGGGAPHAHDRETGGQIPLEDARVE